MARVYNFSAGPATLPLEVLKEAQEFLAEYPSEGMSVMEMSHRSAFWSERYDGIVANIRKLAGISDDYEVLFLQGGASSQFAMIPLNLLADGASADYITTGTWSVKAYAEAVKLGKTVREAGSSKETGFDRIPTALDFDTNAAYVHYTSNNTIKGTQWTAPPAADRPLICDASSDIFSRPLVLDGHDLVYAGAQKNLGPAGTTLVIVRKDILDRAPADTPTMFTYATHAGKNSHFNTAPVFAIYMVGLVIEWLLRKGSLETIEAHNKAKAALLYDAIDGSDFYRGAVQKESRSLMNVPFALPTPALDARFIAEAGEAGLKTLKGHRSVGGCRASIYNAMPTEGVQALVDFMADFEKRNG